MNEGTIIRAEQTHERAAVLDLVAAAFVDDGLVARVVQALDDSGDAPPGLSLVAVAPQGRGGEAGTVVGHVLGSRALLDARQRLVEAVVLGPLSVTESARGQGIGGRLIEALVQAAAAAGYPAVFLEGDPGFYSRFGFAAAEPLGFRRPSLRIPAPAFQVRLLPGHEAWMSGTLVYPRAFWDHDSVGLRDPDLAQIEQALGAGEER
ncbi:putative acetyltransferase [Kineosphaera limosa]|uniref:N-acetyltransferase domain-containing protein n=1 Tax=Kineosphaera limosa NBRC 100340 TaxID=1184609 RepID=K6XC49_9MICO|nr:N-acetyltransferase [Kineosphaera limosa]NYD99205.1 putative acetyltransferase [Kineosphaera limosa]GAB96369.1 hypothetical protein KILIM_035_00580 [Kineosphaera limosa NBRC 100340]